MSGFLQGVRDRAVMSFQAGKELLGMTHVETDPEFQSCGQQLDLLRQRVADYIRHVRTILEFLPKVCESGIQLSASIDRASQGSDLAAPVVLDTFFQQTKTLVDETVIRNCEPSVLDHLCTVQAHLEELQNLRDERRKSQLLCDAARDKLESISKRGQPEEIGKVKADHEARLLVVAGQTDQFKAEVSQMWDQRFLIFDLPLQRLVATVFAFSQATYSNMQQLQAAADPAVLQSEFPIS
jgi:hypothetical protein